jgi:hypothetical protein
MPRKHLLPLFTVLVLFGSALTGAAQWLTQSFDLKQGWNAVYLHVDASYQTLNNLVGPGAPVATPIQEVWMWSPSAATQQFVKTPQEPLDTDSHWSSWKRAATGSSKLQQLAGNVACLVYSTTDFTWNLKGRPVAPRHLWSVSGLNFVGFSTDPSTAPDFQAFLRESSVLLQNAEIYEYPGGELGPGNPSKIIAYRTTPVRRGRAYWIHTGDVYNRYYGPFEVFSATDGLAFGDSLSSGTLRLRNLTTNEVTVSLQLVASESDPTGLAPISGEPPLLVRGALNVTNLTYGYTNLSLGSSQSWTLAGRDQVGSEAEVVIGLNRAAISANPDELLAGVLRLTDSLGQMRVDLPVSATVASSAGLWVGGAAVTQVGQYLKSYERDATNALVTTTNGQYVVTGINTNLGSVPRAYPLRLIVHNPAAATADPAVLMQQVFLGPDAFTNYVVATHESFLNRDLLSQARRISVANLPWSEANAGWSFNGKLGGATPLAATVDLDFEDQASNPFLHTYHPDHDNLDSRFNTALPQGSESYTVRREITLTTRPPVDDFDSLTRAGEQVTGEYAESISLLGLARAGGTNDTRRFEIRGAFTLNRINPLPILTTRP